MADRHRRGPLLAALLLAAPTFAETPPDPGPAPVVSIIIDDVGYRLGLGRRAVTLPPEVAIAVLPHAPHGPELAQAAAAGGHEVMLHLPMEADGAPLDAGGLTLAQSRSELIASVDEAFDRVPQAHGINNHMGSRLTRHEAPMRWLMEAIARRGGLYFVDSRTTAETVAETAAAERGLPRARRDLFLDNEPDRDRIRAEFRRMMAMAHKRRSVLAIGHPYPETLDVLAEMLPQLEAAGIKLVPVSELVARQSAERLQAIRDR